MNTHNWVVSLMVVTLIQGFFSVNIMKKNRETYKGYINILKDENQYLHKELKTFYQYGVEVDVYITFKQITSFIIVFFHI